MCWRIVVQPVALSLTDVGLSLRPRSQRWYEELWAGRNDCRPTDALRSAGCRSRFSLCHHVCFSFAGSACARVVFELL